MINIVSVLGFYCCVNGLDQKQLGEGKGLFNLTVHGWETSVRNSRQEPGAGNQAEAFEEHGLGLRTCSACYFILPRTTLPRDGTTGPSHCSPESIKSLANLTPGNLIEAFSQLSLLFQDNSSLCQVSKNPNQASLWRLDVYIGGGVMVRNRN